MKDTLEIFESAAELIGEYSEIVIDKFISGISWVINKLFIHEKKYKHGVSLTKQIQIDFKRRIGMIIPYKRKH